jgi:hypothetical protein
VQGVVVVVAPLRREPEPVGLARLHQRRVVHVALCDQGERTPQVGAQRVGFGSHLVQDVRGGRVDEGVHGVET